MNPLDLSVIGSMMKYKKEKESYSKEGFQQNQSKAYAGLSVLLLLIILIFGVWIWAIIALINYWKLIPTWAKILGILGIFPVIPFGPILTLVVVYASKN